MKVKNDSGTVKMNLSIPREFATLLEQKAHNEFMPMATWVKSYLMKNLLKTGDNETRKSINENGKSMD